MKSTRINSIFQDEQCCGMPVLTLERHPDWSLKQPVTEDVDHYCTWWQTTFLSIMQCIPKKVCPPKRWIILWLTKSLVQSMHRRNNLLTEQNMWTAHLWKHNTTMLRMRSYLNFATLNRNSLTTLIHLILSSFGRQLKPLWGGGISKHTDSWRRNLPFRLTKVNALNVYFSSFFNSSSEPISMTQPRQNPECSPDVLCIQEEVCNCPSPTSNVVEEVSLID